MNNKRLGEAVSVLVEEALLAEATIHEEYPECSGAEYDELFVYLKRLYISIGMRLVKNRREELEQKRLKDLKKLDETKVVFDER